MNMFYVKFIGFLNEMAERSRYGFKALSNLTKNDEKFKGIIYDDRTFVQKEIQTLYKAIHSSSKEIISNSINHLKTWNDVWDCYGVEVVVVKQDFDIWMEVKQMSDKSFKVVVKNGRWYNEMY